MRRKLDTRFPAARIKKIMQTDEDVGKIALAVPVLMSKALELFLQDLCDRTYRVTLKRGVKTLTSLHLKQCVHSFNEFDFLKDVVSKVPDVGGSDTNADDRSAKRRISKCGDEDNNTEEETKKRKHEAGDNNTWRGRGRGRGRGRSSCSTRGLVMDSASYDKYEEDPGSPENDCVPPHTTALPEETVATMSSKSAPVRNFDLNLEFVDNGNTPQVTSTSSLMATVSEPKHRLKNGYLEWSIPGMDRIIVDPLHLALSHRILGEEEEDYDNEE